MNDTLLNIIKFFLAALLFPVVWVTAILFYEYISDLPGTYGDFFLWGVLGFLLLFLFIYQFWGVHEFGQRAVAGFFRFLSPINHFLSRIISFYVTFILLLFFVVKNFLGTNRYDHYFMFFAGFTLTMHILLTARDLQEQEESFIKPAYLFVMVPAFILTIFGVILLLDFPLGEFSFLNFFQDFMGESLKMYWSLFKNLI